MPIIHKQNSNIREDKNIVSLLQRLPDNELKSSFTDQQLEGLKIALGARDWKTHGLDIRFTFPFFSKRFYVVFIAGKSRRTARLQKFILRKLEIIFIALFLMVGFLLVVIVLYLLKSALGIDIFSDFSFGLWDWFKHDL